MSTETMTPAQELRAAVEKIRQTANGTSHTGPWTTDRWFVMTESGTVADVDHPGDAGHIALWHPGVAMVIAGWLHAVAIDCESDVETYHHIKERTTALTVARAINGEVSA